jgi:hypothetical protein
MRCLSGSGVALAALFAGAFGRLPGGGVGGIPSASGRLGRVRVARAEAVRGGMAVGYLEALDPERTLRELATSEAPFVSCYSGGMRKLFGLIWRGYHGQRAASSLLPGAMMFRASVRRGKTHDPTPQLAKDGICGA